jgi:ATP-binding cassette, subfamily B, multidrug efflux pump
MKHIRKLIPFLKPYWWLSTLSLLFLAGVLLLDLAIPRLIQVIIDDGINQNNMDVVIRTSAIMLGMSAVSTVLALGNNYYSVLAAESIGRDIRDALFLKIQSLSYGNIDQFTTGRLMVRLSSDTTAVQRMIQVLLRIGTRAPVIMVGSLILMFNTNRELSLTMLPLLLITTALIVWFSFMMEPLYRVIQQKLDWLNTVLQENIAGARLVKAFVRADYEGTRFETSNQDFTERTIRVTQFMSSMTPVLTLCVNIGMVIVIWAGGLDSIRGGLTQGQIVAFTNYLLITMGPLGLMALLSNILANGMASLQRVNEVLDTDPEVREAPNAFTLPDNIQGRVAFEHVYFHYNGDNNRPVLEDISLVAEPGQMVAVLGATGAGKTTLVNLIPRFYDASQGQILIDGHDVREVSQRSLISHIGIVPQETILFSGSVRDNIRYGRPDASEDEVVTAAKAAQAHDFIVKLTKGYDTHVEERGVNLSGGQKQRLAIARAILTKPKILIFDDSTSAVDVETETRIQAALKAQMHDRTSIVVAQRISTVLNADKIIVLDKGRVAAEGTHHQLMTSSPIYREIYDSQLGEGFNTDQIKSELQEAMAS